MIKETVLSLEWPTTYWLKAADGKPQKVLLLLHGYRQTGEHIFHHFSELADEHTTVVAPNGLFPVPVKRQNGWQLGAAWYFFDPETKQYYIDMQPAVNYLLRLLEKLQLRGLPVVVIGFSQGGYIAPFLAEQMPNCRQVIGIGSRFRSEVLTGKYHFRFDAIHGTDDDAVDLRRSRECHRQIILRGNLGDFHALDNVGHKIDRAVIGAVKNLIE